MPKDFDPIAAVVDWLDACRRRDLSGLLDLYAADASLECACDGATPKVSPRMGFWLPTVTPFSLGVRPPNTGGPPTRWIKRCDWGARPSRAAQGSLPLGVGVERVGKGAESRESENEDWLRHPSAAAARRPQARFSSANPAVLGYSTRP